MCEPSTALHSSMLSHIGMPVHDEVSVPAFALHVIVPPPTYPTSHVTICVWVVVPVMLPVSLLSEFFTSVAPHAAAVQLTVVSQSEVAMPALAVHIIVPPPV
jgi:hypothetical protein